MDCTSSRNIKWMTWTFRAAPVQHLPKKCGQRPTKGIKGPHLRDELAPRIGFEEPHALYRAQPANLGALGPLIRVSKDEGLKNHLILLSPYRQWWQGHTRLQGTARKSRCVRSPHQLSSAGWVRMRGLKTTSSSTAHTDSDDRGIPGFETLPLRNTFKKNNPRRAEANTPQSTLYTFHCPPCTLDFTICTLHWALHTLHFALHTPHFTLHTLHFTLHTLHPTLHTLHFVLHTSHFTLCTLHSTLYTLHFTLHTPQFTLDTSHSTLHTSHSALYTGHFTPFTLLCTLHTGAGTCCYLVLANCRNFFAICTFLDYGLWAVFLLRAVADFDSNSQKPFTSSPSKTDMKRNKIVTICANFTSVPLTLAAAVNVKNSSARKKMKAVRLNRAFRIDANKSMPKTGRKISPP